MFQNNARIENLTGIRFYEQDILYDDHTYSGDIEIIIKADYVSPGFGIALLNNEGLSLQEQKEMFLFRTGFRESSVIYKYGYSQKNIKRSSSAFEPPHNEIYFTFSKQGKNIKLYCSKLDLPLLEYTLPNSNWDKYSLGIYSNAGNVIKSINIASSVPKNWIVNMYNTEGGYVKFVKSGFEFIACKNNAEIEQNNTLLKKGTYFLKYDVDATKENDIKAYVFKSGDERIDNESKNLLIDNTYFVLEEDTLINIKFAGKNGAIKNINLCENLYDQYVPTKDDNSKIKGSYIKIDLDEVEYVTWTGSILNIPDQSIIADESEIPYVITNNYETLDIDKLRIDLNKMYIYTYYTDTMKLVIEDRNNSNNVVVHNFNRDTDSLTIFNNMDALVIELKIKKEQEDELLDFIKDNSTKKYVQRDIASPIIVVDNENIPLDLSSSYRFIYVPLSEDDPTSTYKKYIFTNIEREIFEADEYIKLSKLPSREKNKIKVYGIYKNAKINEDNFYANSKEGIDDLILYTNNYVILDKTKISYTNENTGEIYLTEIEDFESIIVDYEKRDSYCINYLPEVSMYEVLIANEGQESTMLYDEPILKNGILESELYRPLKANSTTYLKPVNKQYIVLRKEWND